MCQRVYRHIIDDDNTWYARFIIYISAELLWCCFIVISILAADDFIEALYAHFIFHRISLFTFDMKIFDKARSDD